jgi:4-amino-4-deoxy-L-arabinose transferase-like glycosyltransferase
MASQKRSRNWPLFASLAAIVAIAVALRIAWVAYANVNPLDGRSDDTVFYYLQGGALAQHLAYRNLDGSFTAHWPPGYPFALSAVFATFGIHLVAAKALNVALSAATVVVTYAIGAKWFGGRTGLLAALLLALAPGHIYFSTLVMAECLFTFGFVSVAALLIWWTIDVAPASWRWRFLDAADPAIEAPVLSRWQEPRMFALGVAVGFLTLVRSEAVFLPPIFIALWVVVLPRWRPMLWHAAIFGAGFVLALTPWTVRNYVRFNAFLPLREGSQSALANGLDRDYLNRSDRFTSPGPPLNDVATHMARHPWELVPLELAKLRYLYRNDSDGIAWLQHDNRLVLTWPEARRWSRAADRYFFAIGMAAVAAAFLLWRAPDRRRTALAYVIAAWTAVLVISWPETRYHLPIEPLLCIFAAWTLASAGGWLLEHARPSRSAFAPNRTSTSR